LYYLGPNLHCDQNTATSNCQKSQTFHVTGCEERRIRDEELSAANSENPEKIILWCVMLKNN